MSRLESSHFLGDCLDDFFGQQGAGDECRLRFAASASLSFPFGVKLLPIILIWILCGACRSSQSQVDPLNLGKLYINGKASDVCSLGLSTFEQKHYYFEVTDSDLNNAPRWMKSAAYPPVSPRDAEAAARTEARRLRPDVTSWHLDGIELRPVVEDCWCYHVAFSRGDVFVGLRELLRIPVLMNGYAVHGATTSQLEK